MGILRNASKGMYTSIVKCVDKEVRNLIMYNALEQILTTNKVSMEKIEQGIDKLLSSKNITSLADSYQAIAGKKISVVVSIIDGPSVVKRIENMAKGKEYALVGTKCKATITITDPAIGEKKTYEHTFEIEEKDVVRINIVPEDEHVKKSDR